MIQKDSIIELRTKDAIYSPCQIVALSDNNITVTYYAGVKKNRQTGEMHESRPVEVIPRKKIVSMSERY